MKKQGDDAANESFVRNEQHDDSELELVAYLYVSIAVLCSCLLIGIAATGALGLCWLSASSVFSLGSLTAVVCGRWWLFGLRVLHWLWYFRRKLWRLHRLKIAAVIIAAAISNAGLVVNNGARVRLSRCSGRMVDSLDHLELPLALFKKETGEVRSVLWNSSRRS